MTNSFGLSKEHEQVYSLMRCPLCKQYPIVPKYFKIDETPIPPKTPYPEMERSAIAECPKCKQRWAVFSESQPGMVRQKTKIMTVQSNKPGKVTEKKQPTVSGISSLTILETERVEEFLGSEQRLVDNSNSATKLTRKFTISKEWSQSYMIEYEKTTTRGGESGLGLQLFNLNLGNLKLTAQNNLKEKYSISESSKQTYGEEIVIEIPPYTKLRIFFQWKRLWQHGLIKFKDRSGTEFEVPFRVVIGVTFDQMQVDEK
ncbi:MAG: hypothetical protein HXY43_03555 [Fischerella sp.]|jgi:hypothetical protein|uniref:hypothetical protein n=1 Tax=Fischerella sp. TaxID=1191 RepID=UPI0017DD0914|nr:hypothetical protein [Fischerella sp.]NWF58397.1 hypothetical protein [Fischerella sp.]